LALACLKVRMAVNRSSHPSCWTEDLYDKAVLKEDGHWVTAGRRGKGAELHLCQADKLKPELNLEPGEQGISFITGASLDEVYQTILRRGVEFERHPLKTRRG
jgi:hypothetical protein